MLIDRYDPENVFARVPELADPWPRRAVISNPTQGQRESTPRTMRRHLPSRILAMADESGR
jgi:hypothetical protein